ncbi:HEPACAM family member 2 [Pitangus sulphuratus]|nr:HEPACAM family member 2 [Pitangus sulphuratus]
MCFSILLLVIPHLAGVLLQGRSGICSALKLTVPSHTIHGIEGQPLHLTVDYNFNATASEIQIIWLFERPQSNPKYLLGSVNQTVVPDLEYQHKFTLVPPNASLMINPLRISDEGNYIVKVNVRGNGTIAASQKIQVAVDVPVTKPTVHTEPSSGVVEYVGNITLKCTVGKGTRVTYQWMKNGKRLHAGPNYTFSSNNATLLIVPVVKEDIGNYSCLVSNPVSAMESEIIAPTIYYGPYGLRVKSDKGLHIGAVFTIDMGEVILFDCSADSNPPNTYSWIRRDDNTTHVIKYGPHLEIVSDKVAQKTIDYMCRAFNNMTGRRDETHFTIVVTSVGHESASDDFGIYEFVAFPDLASGSRVSSQSVPGSDFVPGQDVLSTVYEVIQHVPDQPQQDHQQQTLLLTRQLKEHGDESNTLFSLLIEVIHKEEKSGDVEYVLEQASFRFEQNGYICQALARVYIKEKKYDSALNWAKAA